MNFFAYLRLYKIQLVKTINCFITFLCLGGCSTLLGSSLLDIQIRVRKPFDVVTGLVPSRSIGYMIGGVVAGFLEGKIEPNCAMGFAALFGSIAIGLAPWFTTFNPIYACFLFSGFSSGILDIFCNAYVFNIWGDQVAFYIQILHSSFGLGSLLTPLIARSFLLPSTNESLSDEAIFALYSPDDVKVQYAFMIIAVTLFCISFGYAIFYFIDKSRKQIEVPKEEPDKQKPWKKYLCIGIAGLIANCSFGIQMIVGSLAPAFSVKADIHMTKQTGAALVSVFWICYTFYRYVHIGIAKIFKERKILYCSYLLTIAGALVMIPHAARYSECTWISIILLGIGYSPTFTASLAILQEYFYLSNRLLSVVYFFGTVGESIHPWILTFFMNTKPIAFTYYLGIISVVQVFACFSLNMICDKIFKKEDRRDVSRTGSIRSYAR
ncbi:sodium-dependent glucose transporter 1C-like [Tetranychus urticae]|uniref:Major facilitator superfamily (MFS) profile domain-containing protein n=1 Tax=Tetranychus urticae TaxID=32264 RepID=T1L4Q1_TETUR|nr:sodium-dependent glucose transporter 1C-like [Tetranychus urticae]